MCVIKLHAFIYFLRPPPWSGTLKSSGLWHLFQICKIPLVSILKKLAKCLSIFRPVQCESVALLMVCKSTSKWNSTDMKKPGFWIFFRFAKLLLWVFSNSMLNITTVHALLGGLIVPLQGETYTYKRSSQPAACHWSTGSHFWVQADLL